jgi:hypothetical protein
MATDAPQKKRGQKMQEIELRPDGWARFTQAVDAAVKSGPKHRAASERKKRKTKK